MQKWLDGQGTALSFSQVQQSALTLMSLQYPTPVTLAFSLPVASVDADCETWRSARAPFVPESAPSMIPALADAGPAAGMSMAAQTSARGANTLMILDMVFPSADW